ncbi:replication protein A 70 kDa DNA-binding subunit B [Tanacetum coccineum]
MFKFEPLIREGQCYILSNFGVTENSGRLPLLPNRWKVSFFKGTEVTRIEQIDENMIGFVNEPFSRILDTNNEYHEHDCVDVIGTVVSIGKIVPVNGHGCSKARRTVVIEDTDSMRLECTFWDKWACMWNESVEKLDEVGYMDFVLILAKIKYWNIHNALFGSRIFVNKELTPLKSFRKSYEEKSGNNESEFKIEIHNPESHIVTPAEFMKGCLSKMVGMIQDIEPGTFCVVYATIHRIQYDNGWAYTGCKSCNSKVYQSASKGHSSSRNKKQVWYCKNHGETYAAVPMFKIIVRIFDESGSAQVVLFDNNVIKMTKLSAWEIMEDQGMDVDNYFPDDLNQIIGKKYLFKIKFSEFNHKNNSHVYRVEKVSEDIETIKYFKSGLLEYEVEDEDYTSESNETNNDAEDDISSPQNDSEDDPMSPSTEMNEAAEDDISSPINKPNKDNENPEDEMTSNDQRSINCAGLFPERSVLRQALSTAFPVSDEAPCSISSLKWATPNSPIVLFLHQIAYPWWGRCFGGGRVSSIADQIDPSWLDRLGLSRFKQFFFDRNVANGPHATKEEALGAASSTIFSLRALVLLATKVGPIFGESRTYVEGFVIVAIGKKLVVVLVGIVETVSASSTRVNGTVGGFNGISVVLSTSNDRWYFSLSSSGEFSVKDTRLAIDD